MIEDIESPTLDRRRFADVKVIEGWMRGTYVVAGIFAIPAAELTVADLNTNIQDLYSSTKVARHGRWPRGIAGTFLFPFYLGQGFAPELIERVQRRHSYKWAIWHEPVLYDIRENAAWMRSDYGHFGSDFHPLVFDLYRRAFTLIAERLQKAQPDYINGHRTTN